ncbi:MAG: DUF456 domain-containing protein [Chloroflexi bacterium]|nr:DUF456 domain-containing protein [Chloroflexota bacterium]
MAILLESISFGLVVGFIVLGLIGTVIPMIPGTLLMWVAVLIYVLVNGMASVGWFAFIIITLIALASGTADLWMPLLGAKTVGTSGRGMVYGIIGATIGTFIAPLVGTLIGYAGGILLGEYQKSQDWQVALKASLGGLAGWGLATAVQIGGGLLILIIFAVRALSV